MISGFDRILLVCILNIGIQLKTKFSLSSALKILAFPLALQIVNPLPTSMYVRTSVHVHTAGFLASHCFLPRC